MEMKYELNYIILGRLYVCDLCFETCQLTHSLEIFIELI